MLCPTERDAIEARLTEFAEAGLMIARGDLAERWPRFEPVPEDVSLNVQVVFTADHPECLGRGLGSFVECFERHGRDCDLFVLDDSADEDVEAANRAVATDVSRGYSGKIFHLGRREKNRLVDRLTQTGLPRHLLSFAVYGVPELSYTCGANRNAAFLLLAGRPFSSVDDDVVCRLSPVPGSEERGIGLSADPDPTRLTFFADRASALDVAESTEADPLKLHEQILGQSLRECLHRLGRPVDARLDHADDAFLRALDRDVGHVRVTSLGVKGDSGMGHSCYALFQRGESRANLVRSETDFQTLAGTRAVQRSVGETTLSSRPHLMTLATAFDNRVLLPAFLPVMRNADGLFAMVLRAVDSGAYIGHLPWMIGHDPLEARAFDPDDASRRAAAIHTADVMALCIESFSGPPVTGDSRARYAALGNHLRWQGSAGSEEFWSYIQHRWARHLGDRISLLEQTLSMYDSRPAFWAEALETHIEVLEQAATKTDDLCPGDLRPSRSPREAIDLVRQLVARYGELLVCWPDIVEQARLLRDTGELPAICIKNGGDLTEKS